MTDYANLPLFCLLCAAPSAVDRVRSEERAAQVVTRPPVEDELAYVRLECSHTRWVSWVVLDAAQRKRDEAEAAA